MKIQQFVFFIMQRSDEMLSQNLKRIRLEQRYTRKQLAKVANTTATTIQSIETEQNDNPRLKTVMGLAKALKVSVNTLIK